MGVIKRVRKSLPPVVARELWVKSGGRCQYDSCNILLLQDSLTKRGINKAYISHIVAASPDGPRGSRTDSELLEIDFNNLMLLCDECHNRIDEANVADHSVDFLRKMKINHERRIEFLTSLTPEKRTHVIFYGANIGSHTCPLTFQDAINALLPDYYPFDDRPIELQLNQRTFSDDEETYWKVEENSLVRQFSAQLNYLKNSSPIQHYSLFALAPQPLLIKLGTLLNDLYPSKIYQLQREPTTWQWSKNETETEFELVKPKISAENVALKIELSGTISDDRITSIMGSELSIWSIKIEKPHNDFLKSKNQLTGFRKIVRTAFNDIKAMHGQSINLHVFPAMPVSAAVEFGRVWMPKADVPFLVYDQNNAKGGFIKTLLIK